MTKREAILCLIAAFTLVTGGLVWLTGPWGMIASGVALGAVILFAVDIRERDE